MSDLTTYRIREEADCEECDDSLRRLMNHHVLLVSDTRLQAITEAWKKQREYASSNPDGSDDWISDPNTSCFIELVALLDALTEEDQ